MPVRRSFPSGHVVTAAELNDQAAAGIYEFASASVRDSSFGGTPARGSILAWLIDTSQMTTPDGAGGWLLLEQVERAAGGQGAYFGPIPSRDPTWELIGGVYPIGKLPPTAPYRVQSGSISAVRYLRNADAEHTTLEVSGDATLQFQLATQVQILAVADGGDGGHSASVPSEGTYNGGGGGGGGGIDHGILDIPIGSELRITRSAGAALVRLDGVNLYASTRGGDGGDAAPYGRGGDGDAGGSGGGGGWGGVGFTGGGIGEDGNAVDYDEGTDGNHGQGGSFLRSGPASGDSVEDAGVPLRLTYAGVFRSFAAGGGRGRSSAVGQVSARGGTINGFGCGGGGGSGGIARTHGTAGVTLIRYAPRGMPLIPWTIPAAGSG